MTNAQAQAYAILALKRLVDERVVELKKPVNEVLWTLDYEMKDLFEKLHEGAAQKKQMNF